MRNKKIKIMAGCLVLVVGGFLFLHKGGGGAGDGEATKEVKPFPGTIENVISTTGTVLPKNRLEIKPPVDGRIEKIFVKEGEKVKVGQVLAEMSSMERAALLDAARGQGEESLKYWQDAYKAISLIASIDGEVIVATTQPGQTVTKSDAVIVLSDKLIVRAQVDETDIGRIRLGQQAIVMLDAYPDVKIKAKVDHIYYESKTVNNVTIYEADLLPEALPEFFRSGMNATVDFIAESKTNVLLLPSEAVLKGRAGSYVLVKEADGKGYTQRPVKTGMNDDKNTEILSGIDAQDTVVVKMKKYMLPQSSTGKNPFMPSRGQQRPNRQN